MLQFEERVRAEVERHMRERGASEDEIAAATASVSASVIGVRHKVRGIGTDDETINKQRRTARTPEEIDAFARWLPGGANRGGRTDERAVRLADYADAIRALAGEKRYRPVEITVSRVCERLHRTGGESQVRKDMSDPDIGGWKLFRESVLSGRFSGR